MDEWWKGSSTSLVVFCLSLDTMFNCFSLQDHALSKFFLVTDFLSCKSRYPTLTVLVTLTSQDESM